MVAQTLRAMASGGMYDQVGGGFARYSVDPYWLVPHFEKMLYDNALLARAYLHGWQLTRRRRCSGASPRRRSTGRCARCGPPRAASSRRSTPTRKAWRASSTSGASRSCVRRLPTSRTPTRRSPGSARPTAATSRAPTSPCAAPASPSASTTGGARLYEVRSKRVWPGLDDKRLTSWNALMISALAEAGAVLERADYLEAAAGCAEFVLGSLRDDAGAAAAHLEGRSRAPQRLPRGSRLPARGAAHALRVELRAALVRGGALRSRTR